MMQQILEENKDELRKICQMLKIKRLYAFGLLTNILHISLYLPF